MRPVKLWFVLPLLLLGSRAHGLGLEQVRFLVVDPQTRNPLSAAEVTVEDTTGRHVAQTLLSGWISGGASPVFDLRAWKVANGASATRPTLITLPAGTSISLQAQPGPPSSGPPTPDIYIKVTARRLPSTVQANNPGAGTIIRPSATTQGAGGTVNNLIGGGKVSGAATDSAGQIHFRGEHADISYVVDGVPLPDTLSGRQGSIVVPATIQSLDVLTGGFAPEFGGQTAGILDITTLPGATKRHIDLDFDGGSYDTTNGDFTLLGPIGKYASYVVNLNATRTRNYLEPQQPDDQTAHNTGSNLSYFAKVGFAPSGKDRLSLTLSRAPATYQISNRTGLPASFAPYGQGFGFLGLRNADGSRPDVTPDTMGLLGAQDILLPSQEADLMDINAREVNEFATLSWRRALSARDEGLLSVTVLHSGQDITNHNPYVDVTNLPVDNSIEYNPTSIRNVHQTQFTGSYTAPRGQHRFKTGFLVDDQYGNESYQIVPASQLALDEEAALSANLAPPGAIQMDAQGSPVMDIDGHPVYKATGAAPTLSVHRSGFYRAAYIQDTWQIKRLTSNYGLRLDWYKQSQTLGQPTVNVAILSPRLNFSYALDRVTALRASYDRLLNTPPLAQGAVVGAPIQPEILDQYDVSAEHELTPGQSIKLAYYIKQIRNQVDTGLLIPGSEIGVYSAVNFQYGGVHGIEFSYDLTPPKGVGWDAYLNYTYSIASPNGVDNTGAQVPTFNDHDQRNTLGLGGGYTWKNESNIAIVVSHGSGLASSSLTPTGHRIPRTQVDLTMTTGPRIFHRHGGVALEIDNLFDDRSVINFESGFSGTRFVQGRRVLFSVFGNF